MPFCSDITNTCLHSMLPQVVVVVILVGSSSSSSIIDNVTAKLLLGATDTDLVEVWHEQIRSRPHCCSVIFDLQSTKTNFVQ